MMSFWSHFAAYVPVVVLVLGLLIGLWARVRRRRRGERSAAATGDKEGVLLVPDAPPEDVEVTSSSFVVGIEPEDRRSRWGRGLLILGILAAVSFAANAVFFTPSNPVSGKQHPLPVVVADPTEPDPGSGTTAASATADTASSATVVDSVRGLVMRSWSGDGQSGEPHRPLRRALSVVIRNESGRPVEGLAIHFQVADGGGTVDPERTATNELGLATSVWRLGDVEDSLKVRVEAPGSDALRLTYSARFTERGRERLVERAVSAVSDSLDTASEERAPPELTAVPRTLAELRPRASLAAGGIHTCQLDARDEVTCWGGDDTDSGPVGGAAAPRLTLRTVVAGVFHSCGLVVGGTIHCWPARAGGEATLAAPAGSVTLPGGEIPVDVVAASEHSCALASSGAVYCWGSNTHGQLGDGTTDDSGAPVRVRDLPPAAQLSTGWLHSCALARDGRAYCWGANASGQLGDGSTQDRARARPVGTATRFTELTAGSAHTCARTERGRVLCWGANGKGQLGKGERTSSLHPIPIQSRVRFRTVAAGGTHTCGLSQSGAAWCWGGNMFGQLGDGSWSDSAVPIEVAGGHSFVALDAGAAHTCGQLSSEDLYCWGNNIEGQLGDGSRENRSRPVRRVDR
ncbi:MAG: RCC1 domain-containing protein [Gemmatimonadota bacterium]